MKRILIFLAAITSISLIPLLALPPVPKQLRIIPLVTPTPGVDEVYATTSTGVALYWTVFRTATPAPAVLVLHPGGYKGGNRGPIDPVCYDLQAAGFAAYAVEYRLAPQHVQMNSHTAGGTHPVPGQDDASPVDDGHYPEQTDDVMLAIHTARLDSRCNGLVYAVGGSAGASHALYALGAGIAGDTRPDLIVCNSTGVSNLGDPVVLGYTCAPGQTCPHSAIMNYEGITDTWPTYSGGVLATLLSHSPVNFLAYGQPPVFVVISNKDSLGIPTSTGLAMHSYNDDGTIGQDETNVSGGLIPKLESLGITESTSAVPVIHTYKKLIVQTPIHAHAFNYWDTPINGVSGQTTGQAEIAWLLGGPVGTPTPSPTPTPTPTATPSRKAFPGGLVNVIGGCPVNNPNPEDFYSCFNATDLVSLNASWVRGIRIRPPADAFEATENVFTWGHLNDDVAMAASHGKFIGFGADFGRGGTPDWMYEGAPYCSSDINTGVQGCIRFPIDIDNDPGRPYQPVPWNEIYLSRLHAFILAMGAQYDGNPTVRYVIASGFMQRNEMYLSNSPNDDIHWNAQAVADLFLNKSAAYQYAAKKIIDYWHEAFTRTPVILTVSRIWRGGSQTDIDAVVNYQINQYPHWGGTMTAQGHAFLVMPPPLPDQLYPIGNQQAYNSTNANGKFYVPPNPNPSPAPIPVNDYCAKLLNDSLQFGEIYSPDLIDYHTGGEGDPVVLEATSAAMEANRP